MRQSRPRRRWSLTWFTSQMKVSSKGPERKVPTVAVVLEIEDSWESGCSELRLVPQSIGALALSQPVHTGPDGVRAIPPGSDQPKDAPRRLEHSPPSSGVGRSPTQALADRVGVDRTQRIDNIPGIDAAGRDSCSEERRLILGL